MPYSIPGIHAHAVWLDLVQPVGLVVLDLTQLGESGLNFDAAWNPTGHGWDATPSSTSSCGCGHPHRASERRAPRR